MSKQEKLKRRLGELRSDFLWEELVSLLEAHGFRLQKSSGCSSRRFVHLSGYVFSVHQPHPSNVMKKYALRIALRALEETGECP